MISWFIVTNYYHDFMVEGAAERDLAHKYVHLLLSISDYEQ
jgi:hypothetical protein